MAGADHDPRGGGLTVREIRCSTLPRIMRCPASAVPPQRPVVSDSPEARLGTAAHRLLAGWIDNGDWPTDYADRAAFHGVDEDALRFLVTGGLPIWERLADTLCNVRVEVSVRREITADTYLVGTADLLALTVDGAQPAVVDWKSGETDARHQLLGYAWAAYSGLTLTTPVVCATGHLRDRALDVFRVTPEELDAWATDLSDALDWPDTYTDEPSPCAYCPRRHECEHHGDLLRSASVALAAPVGGLPTTVEDLAALKPQRDALTKALDSYDAALREGLRSAGGPVPTGDGREVSLERQETETVRFGPGAVAALSEAWEVKVDGVLELLSGVTIPKRALESAVAVRAPARGKARMMRDVLGLLRAAGAVETGTRETLRTRRIASQAEAVE